MVKLDVRVPNDGYAHVYCWFCRRETIQPVLHEGLKLYACTTCGGIYPRRLVIDPEVAWWTDETGEYWHEAAGVFVRDPAGRFLFFERTGFPFGLTPPAGHGAPGEPPLHCAGRELGEEVGLFGGQLVWISTDDIVGDECGRGADAHRWHAYGLVLSEFVTVTVEEEGVRPVWLTLEEALVSNLTFATRYVMTHNLDKLSRL